MCVSEPSTDKIPLQHRSRYSIPFSEIKYRVHIRMRNVITFTRKAKEIGIHDNPVVARLCLNRKAGSMIDSPVVTKNRCFSIHGDRIYLQVGYSIIADAH